MDLDQLDSELGGPMRVRVDGKVYEVPPATELPWRVVQACVSNANYFMKLVWPREARIAAWKIDAAQQRWIVHNGLPFAGQLTRLVYMLKKFPDAIEADLRAKFDVSMGDMWRDRHWRELLSLIDHLPRDSHMNKLLSQDEEYMKRVLAKNGDGSGKPSMADWSQTNAMLADLIDAVQKNTIAVQVYSGNHKGPQPKIDPYPRPATAAAKVRRDLDRQAHEEMNAILLRNRGQSG